MSKHIKKYIRKNKKYMLRTMRSAVTLFTTALLILSSIFWYRPPSALSAQFTRAWTTYNDFNFRYGTDTNPASIQSNVTLNDSGNPTNANLGNTKLRYYSTVIENADTASNWVSSDATSLAVSQETTDKQEGTGSVKMVQVVAMVFDGGDGSDGAIDLVNGGGAGGCTGTGLSWDAGLSTCTVALGTKSTFNFTTVNIPSGTTLKINGPYTSSTSILSIKATGNVEIGGTINLSGLGYAGGSGGGYNDGVGPGGGKKGAYSFGGGGGGYGGAGGSGTGTSCGGEYCTGGSAYSSVDHGSGGGAGYFKPGGAGGGGIQIASNNSINISGTISANGAQGAVCTSDSKSSSGGGSGGRIHLRSSNLVTISGIIAANGGNGGSTCAGKGAGGGGGRIIIDYGSINTAGSTITVTGGLGGLPSGSDGVYTPSQLAGPGTATVTKSPALDLSGHPYFKFWIKSSRTGQYMQMQMGETTASENTYNITINAANTWEQKTWDISGIADSSKNAITKVVLNVTDATTGFTVYVDDVKAEGYAASGTIANLILDAAATSTWGNLSWSATTPSGTSVKFRVRVASTEAGLSSATWSSYVTSSPTDVAEADNRWLELEITLQTTDLSVTPTLDSVSLVYVRNAPPDFDATYNSNGLLVSQRTSDGKVDVSYKIKDEDTTSGTVTRDFVTPTFAYNAGAGWVTIAAAYLTYGDPPVGGQITDTNSDTNLDNKVLEGSYLIYTLVWDAKAMAALDGTYTASMQLRATINDNEGVNATAQATDTFALDLKNPASGSLVIDSAQDQLIIAVTDDSPAAMKLSNNSNLTTDAQNLTDSGVWLAYGTDANSDGYGDTPLAASVTKSWVPTGEPETVYFQFKDTYQNTTAISSTTTPAKPINVVVRDLSNVSISDWKLYLSWGVIATPPLGFKHYKVFRSIGGAYSLHATITAIGTNFLVDSNLSSSITYSYKVYAEDNANNITNYSDIVSDKPNGQGGTDTTPPTITSVDVPTSGIETTSATVTWTTDELSNSTVQYGTIVPPAVGSYGTPAPNVSMVTSHSVALTGLTPNTIYYFRVRSQDASGNEAVSDNGGVGHSFTTAQGPLISAVSVSGANDVSCTITWNTNADSDSIVWYSTSPTLSTYSTAGSEVLVGGAGPIYPHTVTLSSLTSNTLYYFLVRSRNAAQLLAEDNNGASYYTCRTTQDTAAPAIQTIGTPMIASTVAGITWQTDEPATTQVEYGIATGSYPTSTTLDSFLTRGHVAVLSPLTASTTYYFRVKSQDAQANLATSTQQTFQTTTPEQVVVGGGGGGLVGVSQSEYDKLKNSYDKVRAELQTLQDTTPPAISGVDVSGIESFQATVSWTTDESANSLVEYGETDEYGLSAGSLERVKEHSIVLKRLKMGTSYVFRVRSSDAHGNESFSESSSYSFTTLFAAEMLEELVEAADVETFQAKLGELIGSSLPSLVPPIISEIAVRDISETGVVIAWRTNVPASSIVAISSSEEWRADSAKPYQTGVGDVGANVRQHEITLVNLKPGTSYHFQINSQNIVGAVGKSKDMMFTTKPSKVRPEVSNVTNTSFEARWVTDVPATSAVTFRDKATGATGEVGEAGRRKAHLVNVENLIPDTSYEVRVYGYDENNNRIESDPFTVRTKKDVDPPVISNFKIENALLPGRTDRLQTVVSWKTNEPANSLVYFGEGIGQTDTLPNKTGQESEFDTDHIILLTALRPATIYRIQAVSADESQNSAHSPIKTILTPRAEESVVDIVTKNFRETFDFLLKLR